MVKNLKTLGGSDYVELTWDRPHYDPTKYEVTYSCKLIGREVDYISSRTQILDSNLTNYRVHNLPQDTICSLILLAVYNQVSIDSGIAVTAKTLAELPQR